MQKFFNFVKRKKKTVAEPPSEPSESTQHLIDLVEDFESKKAKAIRELKKLKDLYLKAPPGGKEESEVIEQAHALRDEVEETLDKEAEKHKEKIEEEKSNVFKALQEKKGDRQLAADYNRLDKCLLRLGPVTEDDGFVSLFKLINDQGERGRDVEAEKQLCKFVTGTKGKIDVEGNSLAMRKGICSASPQLAKKMRVADEVCLRLFGHPVKIMSPPKGKIMPTPSYLDGVIYLGEDGPASYNLGGLVFELGNAVKSEEFKEIEGDWKSGAISQKKASDYDITDPWAAKYFEEIVDVDDRRAFVQEFHEWEHLLVAINEQAELGKNLELEGENADFVSYITTIAKGATDGSWLKFQGYFEDPKGGQQHYKGVLQSIKQTKQKKK